jgi:hypothetical protein
MSTKQFTKRRLLVSGLLITPVVLWGIFAAAQQGAGGSVPQKITYQGYIEEGGSPVNGLKDFRFCLVTASDVAAAATVPCSSAIYWERESVSVSAGVFHVILGDGTGGASSSHTSFSAVGGVPLFQRTPLFIRVGVPSGPGSAPTGDTMFADAQELVATPTAFTAEQANNMRVSGRLNVGNDAIVAGGIEIGDHPGTNDPGNGEAWIGGQLRVAGAATVSGAMTVSGALTPSSITGNPTSFLGATTVTGNLNHIGSGTTSQNYSVNGRFQVNGESLRIRQYGISNNGPDLDLNLEPADRSVCAVTGFFNTSCNVFQSNGIWRFEQGGSGWCTVTCFRLTN